MTAEIRSSDTRPGDSGAAQPPARRSDILSGAITVAAILMFVGTGSSVLSTTFQHYFNGGAGTDQTLVIALLLNVALILFGWRRHRELAHEVTVRTAAEERAQQLASKDPLTGFLNRRSLAEEGAAMFVRANTRGKAMALLMLDLDHFKTVNDMHGHATGDALLQQVAVQIAEAMPGVALTARFGGDEFACAFLFDPTTPQRSSASPNSSSAASPSRSEPRGCNCTSRSRSASRGRISIAPASMR